MKTMLFPLVLLWSVARLQAAELPAQGQMFHISSSFPKYVTCDIEFRADGKWPSFFYGRPATTNGFFRFDPAKPEGKFVFHCNNRPQKNGTQDRRTLGELFRDSADTNGVSLRITGVGEASRGEAVKPALFQTTLVGFLEAKGRSLPVNAPAIVRYHPGRGDEKNESLMIDAQWEVKAADLGLSTMAADAVVSVRSRFTAYSAAAIAASSKRR